MVLLASVCPPLAFASCSRIVMLLAVIPGYGVLL